MSPQTNWYNQNLQGLPSKRQPHLTKNSATVETRLASNYENSDSVEHLETHSANLKVKNEINHRKFTDHFVPDRVQSTV